MKTLETITKRAIAQVQLLHKLESDQVKAQRELGAILYPVASNPADYFSGKGPKAIQSAYAKWYRETLGSNKFEVSNALERYRLSILVPDIEPELNVKMLKNIAPIANEKTPTGKERSDKVKANAIRKTWNAAKANAKKEKRSVVASDITAVRTVKSRNGKGTNSTTLASILKGIDTFDTSELRKRTPKSTIMTLTEEDVASLEAFVNNVRIGLENASQFKADQKAKKAS